MCGGLIWQQPYRRLLHLFLVMLKAGMLEASEDVNSKQGLLLDIENKRVAINLNVVAKALRKNGIPTPAITTWVETFQSADVIEDSYQSLSSVPIRWDVWEEARQQWKAEAMDRTLRLHILNA
jgi:hypothetical protein